MCQFCANDPEVFVRAALLAQDYCDAIDLNLGCPQMIAKRGMLFKSNKNKPLRFLLADDRRIIYQLFISKVTMEFSCKMNGSCWRKWVSLRLAYLKTEILIQKGCFIGAVFVIPYGCSHFPVRLANEKLSVPITCKIRVFKEVEKTVRYAQMLERAGCQVWLQRLLFRIHIP